MRRRISGVKDIVEVQLFTNLLNPFFYTLSGQLWLTVFINGRANEVIVICQTFGSFEMVTRRWPVTDDRRTAWLNDVANSAQRITEILSIVFLIATAKQGNQLAVEVYFFQRREEIVPVTLCFTVVPVGMPSSRMS